jgi:hypothetical protein
MDGRRLAGAVGMLLLLAVGLAAEAAPTRERPMWGYGGVGFARALNEEMPGGSIAAHVGFLHRLTSDPAYAVGGEAQWLNLGSSTRSRTIGDTHGLKNDYSYTVVPVTFQISYIPSPSPENPHVAGTLGAGIYSVKQVWENRRNSGMPSLPAKEVTNDAVPGFNAGGGVVYGSKKAALRFGLEARFHFVLTEDRSLSIVTLLGRLYI